MYKKYILILCCFTPALFAADKQEKKYNIIEALDLETCPLLQEISVKGNMSHEYDVKHSPNFVKGLARAYRELKGKYKQEEQRNLELEAIVLKLNEQLAQQNGSAESGKDSSCSSNSTSPASEVAASPALMATLLHLYEDGQYENNSLPNQTAMCPLPKVKKLPSDRYDVNYYKDCRALGSIPF